ncbi:MAG: ABC transporter ATP-binding protein [Eubacteriales bacterium]
MRKLAKYIKPYWKQAVLAPLLMILDVATNLLQPAFMAKIVDVGIANGDINYIIKTGIIMIGIAIMGILGGIGVIVFSSTVSQNISADIRMDLFKKIQSFSFDSLDKFKTSSLITRLTNDVLQIQNIVVGLMRIAIRAPLFCIGGIIMALTINPGLAAILIFTIPVIVIAITIIMKKGFPLFSIVQKKLDGVNGVMRENLTGIRVVKAFVRSDFENKRFETANKEFKAINVQASRLVGMTMPVMMLVMNLSIVAVIWFGGIKVNVGNMQVGEVMAFITYMTQILFSFLMMAFVVIMFSRAKASADRIVEVLETEIDIKDTKEASEEIIKNGRVDFENVSFRYTGAGGEPVLKKISFTALPGETVAILGSTGSGKTTLVNLIPRFYDVTEGRILIDNKDVRDIKLHSLRSSISMVLQETNLFSGTIEYNLRWGNETASEEEMIEVAKVAQAHDFITSFSDGYNTALGQKGVNLSGGQKQRIAIARALMKKPKLLILDDSTSAVDMGTEARLQVALKNMLKGTTTFIIAQRISSVLAADKIMVLEDGEIADMGTHEELIERCAVYQDIYRSQLGKEAV